MLMGKYQNSIDAKSRMIIPAKFREELKGNAVLTMGMDKCLYIYPMKEWEAFIGKLKALPQSDEIARAFVRNFFANAVECDIDKQGRLTIPAEHRAYAGIQKELVTVGNLDKIEIWAREEWENKDNMAALSPAQMAQKMVEYGI